MFEKNYFVDDNKSDDAKPAADSGLEKNRPALMNINSESSDEESELKVSMRTGTTKTRSNKKIDNKLIFKTIQPTIKSKTKDATDLIYSNRRKSPDVQEPEKLNNLKTRFSSVSNKIETGLGELEDKRAQR